MTSTAEKLLQRMKRSKKGWKREDLDRLYLGFGFIILAGSKHDIVKHPEYPQFRITLTRSNDLAVGYVADAIKNIDRL